MVDHVVGDQDVDARVRVRQLLRVDDASCLRSRLGEALAKEELQVRPGTLLLLVAGALRIAGVANEHRLSVVVVISYGWTSTRRDSTRTAQAGSRPHTMRVTPMIARAAAVDHAIAETSGASKSVPDCAAWKKIATNAT